MKIENYKYENVKYLEIFNLFLLALYPIALIAGNLIINLFILLFSINFFINFNKSKIYLNQKISYLLFFFFTTLIINLFFSSDPSASLPRIIKIFFIIIFIFEIQKLIQNFEKTYIKYVYLSWFVTFLFLSIDILFEIIFGHNIFGSTSYIPGRISSLFGDELIAGSFYHGFALFFMSFLIYKKLNNFILIFIIIALLCISFLIGERSNFIKLFFSILLFMSFLSTINLKTKLSVTLIAITIIISTITINENYKLRYYNQLKILFSENGYSKYMKNSMYGTHQDSAYKIFKDNFYFGVGIKNFRNQVWKKKYENKEYKFTAKRSTTHPHQVHYEFLSETGFVGYISFLIFILSSLYLAIKSYFLTKNLFQLSGILFVLTSILPIIPSGSFFSTFSSGIFWINYAIMISYLKKSDFKI